MATLVGIFETMTPVAETVKRLKNRGFTNLEVYSPVPSDDICDAVDEKPSKVRIFTLVGCLTGAFLGYAVPIWMSYNWEVMISGKAFASIPAYTVIGFEANILLGGLATAAGLFIVGGLPKFKLDKAYNSRFSGEEFGVVVQCNESDVAEIEALMRANSATEVNLVEM